MQASRNSDVKGKSYFPVTLDSSTTINFGEIVPTFCQALAPNSSINIDFKSATRFAPLAKPTFGAAWLKNYFYCYRISDLYAPYRELLAAAPYTSSSGTTYVPKELPSVSLSFLWAMVVCNCQFSIYTPVNNAAFANVFSSDTNALLSQEVDLNIFQNTASPDLVTKAFSYALINKLQSQNVIDGVNPANELTNVNPLIFQGGCTYQQAAKDDTGTTLERGVSPVSADFTFYSDTFYKPGQSGEIVSEPKPVVYCCRLTDTGKLIRKILLGLGYEVTLLSNKVSLLPLYAYYKAYFEAFAPKRFVRWEQTDFATVMTYMVQNGKSFHEAAKLTLPIIPTAIKGMIDELASCYYTEDIDYYTEQIIGQLNTYGDTPTPIEYMRSDGSKSSDGGSATVGSSTVSSRTPNIVNSQGLQSNTNFSTHNVLMRFTQFLNTRSVFGAKIADFLKATFGISREQEERNYIGSDILDVNFSDVFSTAETNEGYLGEYAGKAMGFKNLQNFNFDCDEHAYVIGLSVVVPRTQYVNGVNPQLFQIKANDLYNEMYDGLTLQPSSVLSLCAIDHPFQNFKARYANASFGNLPAYTELKTKTQGVLNGDLSLNSTKASYDSYTMDKIIEHSVQDLTEGTQLRYRFLFPNIPLFSAGTMWRYIGKYLWLGRFDRIFVNNRNAVDDELDKTNSYEDISATRKMYRTDDNIIVHNIVDLAINGNMLPISNTFMTNDLDKLNSDGFRADVQ